MDLYISKTTLCEAESQDMSSKKALKNGHGEFGLLDFSLEACVSVWNKDRNLVAGLLVVASRQGKFQFLYENGQRNGIDNNFTYPRSINREGLLPVPIDLH